MITPRGTFIQRYLVKGWTDATWAKELAALKRVGMDTLVIAPAIDTTDQESFYPSRIQGVHRSPTTPNFIEDALRNAQRAGFRVFLGLNSDEGWWKRAGERDWAMAQAKVGNQVADELYAEFKHRYPKTFVGWYWVWEADNLRFIGTAKRALLIDMIEANRSHLRTLDPSMPMLFCPFMKGGLGSAKQYQELWTEVFQKTSLGGGDIFAPQDSVGALGLRVEQVGEWFKALRAAADSKPGIRFWADAETFDERDWRSADLKRFFGQVTAESPYVEGILTFAYSHYYSPVSCNPAWQREYEHFLKAGKLTVTTIESVKSLQAKRVGPGSVELTWASPVPGNPNFGYEVWRGKKWIAGIGISAHPSLALTIKDDHAPEQEPVSYEVVAYDVAGNRSKPTVIQVPAQ